MKAAHHRDKNIQKLHSYPPGCLYRILVKQSVPLITQSFEVLLLSFTRRRSLPAAYPFSFHVYPDAWVPLHLRSLCLSFTHGFMYTGVYVRACLGTCVCCILEGSETIVEGMGLNGAEWEDCHG